MQKRRSPKGKKVFQFPLSIFVILSFLVLLSVIGLDYVGWKNGKKSYIFSVLTKKKKVLPKQETFDEIVLKNLSSQRISSKSIHQP